MGRGWFGPCKGGGANFSTLPFRPPEGVRLRAMKIPPVADLGARQCWGPLCNHHANHCAPRTMEAHPDWSAPDCVAPTPLPREEAEVFLRLEMLDQEPKATRENFLSCPRRSTLSKICPEFGDRSQRRQNLLSFQNLLKCDFMHRHRIRGSSLEFFPFLHGANFDGVGFDRKFWDANFGTQPTFPTNLPNLSKRSG